MPNLSRQFLFDVSVGINSTSTSIPSIAVPIGGGNTFLSHQEKGDGYFGSGDGIHTVTYSVLAGFDGTISMQGSLATSPSSTDWFDIPATSSTYTVLTTPTNITNYVNFTGNFVYVRAKVVKNSGTMQVINYNR